MTLPPEHPPVARLFRVHDPEAAQHVAGCDRCQALRRLGYERTLGASSCAEVELLLAARVVGPMAPDEERRLLEHLEGCSACLAVASDLDGAKVGEALVELGVTPRDFEELRTIDAEFYVRGQEIGRGGMGRIVAARDRRLGREVV